MTASVFAAAVLFCGLIGFSMTTMESPVPQDRINLNTDPAASLVRLQGVGPVLAAAIVDYRREHGAFVRVEDLDAVPRIGPATVDKMRDWISLSNMQSAAE
ncbi:MAG: helix-hairpin-helix domain-containing protein [Anaerohalosphaeraceae bacterium]